MNNKKNLLIDLIFFLTFLAVANPSLTGNTIHEWLALAFGVAIVAHLLFHWEWLLKVTKYFFVNFFHRSRLNYLVDLLFYICVSGSIMSGLLISKVVMSTIGIQLMAIHPGWKIIHVFLSDAVVIFLGVHIALHWRWICNSIGDFFDASQRQILKRKTLLSETAIISLLDKE
jgi:hypothetical protein